MVVLGSLKVVRLRLVPLERLLARTNNTRKPAAAAGAVPLKDRMLSSELLLHGDPAAWLRRGGTRLPGGSNPQGALFLVPKRALQRAIAAELEHDQQQESSPAAPTALPLAVVAPTHAAANCSSAAAAAASALALLEKGDGYRVTLPGLLAQAQPQGGEPLPSSLGKGGGRTTTDSPPAKRDKQWEERARQAFAAVQNGDVASLRSLLDADPSLAASARQPEHGATLLHTAVARVTPTGRGGDDDRDALADPQQEEEEEEEEEEEGVALHMMDMLLDAGADPDARAANGSTALHWAAGNGSAPAVRRLLSRGADAHVGTFTWGRSVTGKASGQTAAHWAAESGYPEVLAAVAAHAPLALVLPDERGRTPRALALASGRAATGAALEGAEAEEWVVVEARVEGSAVRVLRGGGGDGPATHPE